MQFSTRQLSRFIKIVKNNEDEEQVLDALDSIMECFLPSFYVFLLDVSEENPNSEIEQYAYELLTEIVSDTKRAADLRDRILSRFYQKITQKFSLTELPEDVIWKSITIINDEEASPSLQNMSTQMLLQQFTPLIFQRINHYKSTRRDLRDTGDLESAARIALTKAIQKFSNTGGSKFMTFLRNGLHHELIGAYRKMVKQSTVEAVNATDYFHKNDGDVEIEDSDYYEEPNDIESRERAIQFMDYIVDNVELTIGETLYFFMSKGIYSDRYSHKDIKRMFGLNRSQLHSAQLKVYSFLFEKEFSLRDLL